MNKIKYLTLFLIIFIAACSDDAYIASRNISKAADNFEIIRRIVFYNGITGEYMLSLEGLCSIKADGFDRQLEATCKTGSSEYKKHFLGLSDNVTYFSEQIKVSKVNVYHYRVTFKPQQILPDIDFRGSTDSAVEALTPGMNEENINE